MVAESAARPAVQAERQLVGLRTLVRPGRQQAIRPWRGALQWEGDLDALLGVGPFAEHLGLKVLAPVW